MGKIRIQNRFGQKQIFLLFNNYAHLNIYKVRLEKTFASLMKILLIIFLFVSYFDEKIFDDPLKKLIISNLIR